MFLQFFFLNHRWDCCWR